MTRTCALHTERPLERQRKGGCMIVSFRGANEMEIGSMIQRWTRKAQRHREVVILHWRGTEPQQQQQHGVLCVGNLPTRLAAMDQRTDGRRVAAMDGDGQIYLSL
jgi:hypothetical protein